MMKFFQRKPREQAKRPVSAFTTDVLALLGRRGAAPSLIWEQPSIDGVGQDSSINGTPAHFKRGGTYGIPEAQASWYISQSFIGYAMCASIAKQWLVDKAITMPARDAVRQGYRLDGENREALKKLTSRSRDRELNRVMRDFISTGRRFGGAAALFVVDSTDSDYYEKPFNPDGVAPRSYRGIRILEPQWMTPDLVADNIQDPASLSFYEPTFWRIGDRRYHRSHFCFYVPYTVADMAKHQYRYFGVSVPERIYERVYAAERTANEAPQLTMTKRLLTMGIPDLGSADKETIAQNIAYFVEMRDNYGVQISDTGTEFNQFDTTLGDLDATIMTQYQLVAAAANVPAAKLLETTPKGFNATGEYEEASYREGLESIQTNDLEPLLDRHYDILARHEGIRFEDVAIVWNPLDSPTAKEYADINLVKAQTATALVGVGAIDGEDVRRQIAADRDSDYYGIESAPEPDAEMSAEIDRYINEAEQEAAGMGEQSPGSQVGGQAPGVPGPRGPGLREEA